MANNYWRAMAILESNRKRWLKVNPHIPESSGIYILTRVDENEIKYAYVGQAKKILTRLAQHLTQYQHIDLSLKKHGLYDKDKRPYGWAVDYLEYDEDKLDEAERYHIKRLADIGFQLRNKTSGGQDSGKVGIDENKASKGYYDGLAQGRKNAIKEIKEYFDKYLYYATKKDKECFKKDGTLKEIYVKKYEEFKALLEGDK